VKPLLVVLAGPNGSGKSTLCETPTFKAMLRENDIAVVNPDELAKQAPASANALLWSGREVHRAIAEKIGDGSSFLIETTLSGRNHFRTVELARATGFYVALHFIYVSTVEQSKTRVRLRVSAGGHDVPEVDQNRRFEKSLKNFSLLLPHTDEAFVYCNDYSSGHERVAEYLKGNCFWRDLAAPAWLPK
jgi:predicted ABC-type ATPase